MANAAADLTAALSKEQQHYENDDNALADLDASRGAKPVVPPHLLARLSQLDTPD
ncbi:hypothetical protein BGX34_006225, partial [Mortierella sp. NVP85]